MTKRVLAILAAIILGGLLYVLVPLNMNNRDQITVQFTVYMVQQEDETCNDFFTRATNAAKQLQKGGMVHGVKIKYFMYSQTGKYEAMVEASMPVDSK